MSAKSAAANRTRKSRPLPEDKKRAKARAKRARMTVIISQGRNTLRWTQETPAATPEVGSGQANGTS
jgi:hypothetical protein